MSGVAQPMNYEVMPMIVGGEIVGWAVGCLHCRQQAEASTAEGAQHWMSKHDPVHGRTAR